MSSASPHSASDLIPQATDLLAAWFEASEAWWYDVPGRPGEGCYGTGYNNWGVQTNQKYAAAAAALARSHADEALRGRALDRALAAYRFSLASHRSGDGACTDGQQWGHTWISALGIERMMHGLALIGAHLTGADRAAIRRVLTSEADWLMTSHRKGAHHGVFGDKWNHTGKNVPESNLWNGAILWRTAERYPDHPHAEQWRQRAHEFLINSVSIESDADDNTVVADAPIRDRFRGANFFPNYALDHHGYLNVGYMAICASNAAILHFDLKLTHHAAPPTLHHHQAELWGVLRRMIFSDGRLARLGGDSRTRYTYCQEYLLPALLYAADHLRDPHALTLAARQLQLMAHEARHNGDGSFYGRRLAHLHESSPYYYTRLESDRANALGMLLAYGPLTQAPSPPPAAETDDTDASPPALPPAVAAFEADVAGHWFEPEHGAVMHRCPTRLASFAWRAYGLAQGLCVPPDDGHLAEWLHNLTGTVRFMGDNGAFEGGVDPHRRLLRCHTDIFPGGFTTCGAIAEGVGLTVREGWNGSDLAVHHLAMAALPDEHTVVILQLCIAGDARVYTREVKGLQLNLPNDLFSGFRRRLVTENGDVELASPATDQWRPLSTRWAHVEGRLGIVGLYGAETLSVSRSAARRGGKLRSLHVDEICWGGRPTTTAWDPGATLLDVGAAVVCDVTENRLRQFAQARELATLRFPEHPLVRGVSLVTLHDTRRAVLANFGDDEACIKLPSGRSVTLAAGHAAVV